MMTAPTTPSYMICALREWIITLVICSLIAAFTAFANGASYWMNLQVSLVFGLTIVTLTSLSSYLLPTWPNWLRLGLGLVIGFIIGMMHLLYVMFGQLNWQLFNHNRTEILTNILFSLAVCCIVFYFFMSVYRIQHLRREVAEQALATAEKDRQLAISELKLLQGQMEPHFLFNTLANLQGLIDADPARAKRLVNALSTLLRNALQRSRGEFTSLAQELELVTSYLAIQKIRLGERLDYHIDVEDGLMHIQCPPLLIQPLIENALIHAIEPCAVGGEVRLVGRQDNHDAIFTLTNTGLEFGQSVNKGSGMGLHNIHERLELIYNGQAKCQIQPLTTGQGTKVTLKLPIRTQVES